MEVRIGVIHAARELSLESSQSVEAVRQAVSDAITGDESLLVLHDDKGRTLVVPTEKLAYVEIVGDSGRRVGFGTL
jgi:Protein of unknown function (DUF3107)